MRNNQAGILVSSGKKTLEFQLAFANVFETKVATMNNDFYKYLQNYCPNEIGIVNEYLNTIDGSELNEEQRYLVALLLWKCMPGKSVFAQDFANYLEDKIEMGEWNFKVPAYIQNAIFFLTT